MALRQASLGPLKAGITRLRDKGGASPESLFDLRNGYVDASGAPTSRYGTSLDVSLPAGTKGLCTFAGKLHVFALTDIDPGDTGYVVDILIHPDSAFDGTLTAIHFAKPFLGYLYVVAEFSDGAIVHYWMQSAGVWMADQVYKVGDMVRPTTPNGFFYRASSSLNPPAWAPSVPRAVGDVVQPTVYNGWKYTVTAVDGDNPASAATEPEWLESDGAIVYEDQNTTPEPSKPTTTPTLPGDGRYTNLPGRPPGRETNEVIK